MTLTLLLIMIMSVVMMGFIGWLIGADTTIVLRREAIDRGFAQYNATTGKWEWKSDAA
jgi:hypothetical protein